MDANIEKTPENAYLCPMQKRLVSILTPMYNTGKYVHRLLDSVLSQDYPCIEMVVMDDGSTDGSLAVVEGYAARFADRGYTLRYESQPHSGQSVAIKNGLPLISGEYLAWPDSDDYYASSDAISKMVGVLASADEAFQMVRTQVSYVDDGTFRLLQVEGLRAHEEEDRSLFEDCLLGRNGFYYCAGSYLVRTEVLKDLTGFDIYTENSVGQNWQLLLPILYHYRCKTILEPLYTVVLRAGSHSRGPAGGYDWKLARHEADFRTRLETLKRTKGFPQPLWEHYRKQMMSRDNRCLLDLAIKENRRDAALERLPYCRADMGKLAYRTMSLLLQTKGGPRILNACKALHHRLYLYKRRVQSFLRHDR